VGFNSAFKGLKLLKKSGNGRLNNLNDPNRPQCVKGEKYRDNGRHILQRKVYVCTCLHAAQNVRLGYITIQVTVPGPHIMFQNTTPLHVQHSFAYTNKLPNFNKTFQMNQQTRCHSFSSLLLDVYVQLNMFRASSRPSSGAQQLQ